MNALRCICGHARVRHRHHVERCRVPECHCPEFEEATGQRRLIRDVPGVAMFHTRRKAEAAADALRKRGWTRAHTITMVKEEFTDAEGFVIGEDVSHYEVSLEANSSLFLYEDGAGRPRRYGLWKRVERLRQDGLTFKEIAPLVDRSPSSLSQLFRLATRRGWPTEWPANAV